MFLWLWCVFPVAAPQLACAKVLGAIAPIPPLTLPFNIILLLFLFDAEREQSVRSVNPAFIQPSQVSLAYLSRQPKPMFVLDLF